MRLLLQSSKVYANSTLTLPVARPGAFEEADGGLFATQFKSRAAKAIWDFEGRFCHSRHIPGVRFAGTTHPGIIGTAPSQELLDKRNKREQELIDAHPGASPAVALPPEPKGVYVGQDLPKETLAKIAKEGARTIPGRECVALCSTYLSPSLTVFRSLPTDTAETATVRTPDLPDRAYS